jgi:hypothetical protein
MLVLLASGCGKKDGDSKGGAAKASEGAAAQKLPKLGLQIAVDGDVTFGDAIMGEGDLVTGSSVGALQIETWKKPQTLAEAKDDASAFTPKNLKADTLPDGWALSYDNTGSMGANFFVTVRRDLGGKTYKCSTTVSEADQQKGALEACKSLKP